MTCVQPCELSIDDKQGTITAYDNIPWLRIQNYKQIKKGYHPDHNDNDDNDYDNDDNGDYDHEKTIVMVM